MTDNDRSPYPSGIHLLALMAIDILRGKNLGVGAHLVEDPARGSSSAIMPETPALVEKSA